MKLSFSTNRWESCSFDDFIRIAREYKFNGIEIHSIDTPKLRHTDVSGSTRLTG